MFKPRGLHFMGGGGGAYTPKVLKIRVLFLGGIHTEALQYFIFFIVELPKTTDNVLIKKPVSHPTT